MRYEGPEKSPCAFAGIDESLLPPGVTLRKGKVRDIIDLGDALILVATDRMSAFDRAITVLPSKGEILNRLALYWFGKTRDIVDNHLIRQVSPRAALVRKAEVLPVEVVVRGYITGSAWRSYERGSAVPGLSAPAVGEPGGLRFNQKLPEPQITPSTKAEHGAHDEPISSEDIVAQGLVAAPLWEQVQRVALHLFKRGSEIASRRGLILVDTKYEFGVRDGRLLLVDEIHTPDSSRYWFSDSYRDLFEAGQKQRKVDKEYLRQWLMSEGFQGEGSVPHVGDDVLHELEKRYIEAFELITGTKYLPECEGSEAETRNILSCIEEYTHER